MQKIFFLVLAISIPGLANALNLEEISKCRPYLAQLVNQKGSITLHGVVQDILDNPKSWPGWRAADYLSYLADSDSQFLDALARTDTTWSPFLLTLARNHVKAMPLFLKIAREDLEKTNRVKAIRKMTALESIFPGRSFAYLRNILKLTTTPIKDLKIVLWRHLLVVQLNYSKLNIFRPFRSDLMDILKSSSATDIDRFFATYLLSKNMNAAQLNEFQSLMKPYIDLDLAQIVGDAAAQIKSNRAQVHAELIWQGFAKLLNTVNNAQLPPTE